jgi:pimeloyl-ACP methyl ester carboxylesterase
MNGTSTGSGTNAESKILGVPLYFSSAGQSLFGWLHQPAKPTLGNIGLVICAPFGYEALSAHRSVRAFADAAVELGVPTLRFDYLGTGDSVDIDPFADQIETWVGNVIAAVAELRRRAGVDAVLLLGIRLGALLAVLAAAQCPAVTGLILVAPVVSGKRYLRELNTARLAAQLGLTDTDAEHGRSADTVGVPGSMEFSGYPMSAASMDSLAKIDLASLPKPTAHQLLIVDRDDLPSARAWSVALRDAGVRARYVALKGFVEMTLVAAQFAVVPANMIETMREWVRGFATPAGEQTGQYRMASPELSSGEVPAPVLHLPGEVENGQGDVTEYPLVIGAETQLFGILTCPPQSEVRRRGVILLNVGADLHIGASRMHVSLARRWGRSGYHVLRMDLAGLGDSGTRAGRSADDVFPAAALEDIRAGVSYLHDQFGVTEITLAGLCSGAYHALRAAVAQLPIDRIIMVNPQNYFWNEEDSLQNLQIAEMVKNPTVYRKRITDAAAWKRLLSGKVNLWRIFRIYVGRQKLALEAALISIARLLHIRLPHDLGSELEEIVRRGIRVTFVFASGEPGIGLLRIQGGSLLTKLGEKCRLRIIERADHTFSQGAPRATLERILSEELFLRHARSDSVVPADLERNDGVKEGRV